MPSIGLAVLPFTTKTQEVVMYYSRDRILRMTAFILYRVNVVILYIDGHLAVMVMA